MKRITKIRLSDYRAFYGLEDKFEMPNGENVLIYGENGSGKSSLYQALYDFFETSAHGYDFISKPLVENLYKRIERAKEVPSPNNTTGIEVHFNPDKYAVTNSSAGHQAKLIQDARLFRGFLSYQELIQTYVGNSNKLNHFELILTIAANHKATSLHETLGETWRIIKQDSKRRATSKHKVLMQQLVENFNLGLREYLENLNTMGHLNDMLGRHFNHNVKIKFDFNGIAYDPHRWKEDRIVQAQLSFDIDFDSIRLRDYDHEYQTFLNEARLSAIAINIYLASLRTNPTASDYKILFLDDVFIGLDTSNRLPLLSILKEYFSDYQIFISTYDRHWFNIAERWLNVHWSSGFKWKLFEMYNNSTAKKPHVMPTTNYLSKAEDYLIKHDYPSCANFLRKQLERYFKDFLPENKQYVKSKAEDGGVNYAKTNKLRELLDKFKVYCAHNKLSDTVKLINDYQFYIGAILNPFSHDNIDTPIYRNEVEKALELIKKLGDTKTDIILEAGNLLTYRLEKTDGTFWECKIKLLENLRLLKEGVKDSFLTSPECEITRVDDNGTITSPNWQKTLIKFCESKKSAFDSPPNGTVVSIDFFEALKLPNGDPLSSLRKY